MISAHAKDSFERILRRAAETRLPIAQADACIVTPLETDAVAPHTHVVVLTISSMAFRLLLVLHFSESEAMRDYYLGERTDRSLTEVFLEVSNLCCGAVNQSLQSAFPDLGMSTPYVLDARCVPHLSELDPDYLASFAVRIGDAVQLIATVCVCADAPIDFVADLETADASSGELELF